MPNDNRHFAIVVKPVGSLCNLRCSYCYYMGKQTVPGGAVMNDAVLERYIQQVVAIHGKHAEIEFAWHGGEPTLAGIEFYQRALALQAKYAADRRVLNTLQTNGTLLNDAWCTFFKDHDFRIGISIDGPERLHNAYRKDIHGEGTFRQVMRGVELLQKHGVPYNTLTTVNAVNQNFGAEVYAFMRSISNYMQFLPVVECLENSEAVSQSMGLSKGTNSMPVALPPGITSPDVNMPRQFAPFNVSPQGYGRFLCDVFDAWYSADVGRKFVQIIEATVGNMMRKPAGLCVHEAVCGHCAVVERAGDVYRCDRFVFDQYKVGNVMQTPLADMMESNRAFGEYKLESLPAACLHCDVVDLCFGGCPKDRLIERLTLYGLERRNYLCEGYKQFFTKVKAQMTKG